MAKSGQARPIKKLRAVVPEAILDRPDPSRPPDAFVNSALYDMDMADAMDLDNEGKLQRSVLTEQGWYCPQNTQRQQIERKKANKAELVVIQDKQPNEWEM